MQLGNRLFPYPVLNNTKEISEFNESSNFELKITLDNNGEIIKTRDKIILKDVYFNLTNDDLMKLYFEEKISCFMIVESSSSIFRKKFKITNEPQTFEINIGCLKDDVYISAYCVATCDINNYKSESFDSDYKDYEFDLKKYDIVAADDGIKFVMDRNLEEDNKVSSIFVIVKNDASSKTISYDMKKDRIYIYLPQEEHIKYSSVKSQSKWNDIFFSMIAIPVLSSCFSDIKNSYGSNLDLIDVTEQYRWFNSISKSYKKEKNRELDNDTFLNMNTLELAQTVFNYSSINGLRKFCDVVINGGVEDEQD